MASLCRALAPGPVMITGRGGGLPCCDSRGAADAGIRRRAGRAGRRRGQDLEETGPGSQDGVPGPAGGADRAAGRPALADRGDRRRLGIVQDTARKWRARFAPRGPDGLADAPRSRRPRRISAAERAETCAPACPPPPATRGPLSRSTRPELAAA